MLDLLATGYPSLDYVVSVSRIPGVGQTALLGESLGSIIPSFGGCGANVAVALQRLGFQTGLALVLGADAVGDRYCAYLLDEGIDCDNVIRLPGTTTSSSYLFRAPDGEVVNFFHPGASDAWRGDLSLKGLDAVRWGLVTVGYAPYNRAFVDLLSAAQIPLIWQMKADVAAYPPTVIERFAAASRIIFCNRVEADDVCRALGLTDLRGLFAYGVEQVVLTLGGEGSTVLTPLANHIIPAVPARVVDTTGAGDAYTAGYLAGYWRGYDIPACGRLAAATAAFAVEALGCQTNLPDWQHLQARYEENFGAL